MLYFWLGIAFLIIGYFTYGKFIEHIFKVNSTNPTALDKNRDGVDYVDMPLWKITLIQLLNIAGLGPIYGPIAGILFGPAAFLWIALGAVLIGGVHDFISGTISTRNNGRTIGELVGKYMGGSALLLMRGFSILLLMLLAVVFSRGPADILSSYTGISAFTLFIIVIVYYFIATMLPINKIIGRAYPFFGLLLLVMAVLIIATLTLGGYSIPTGSVFSSMHPAGLAIFPFLFVTISCGAVSGFHATQSPMMARCVRNELQLRKAFYGAMILEAMIAMVWAAGTIAFFGSYEAAGKAGTQPEIIKTMSITLLGAIGTWMVILGVVIAPITSGDTCYRVLRLTLADIFKISQVTIKSRLMLAVPLFATGFALYFIDFNVLWRYFTWSNQTLAAITLWLGTAYLIRHNYRYFLVAAIPATFLTSVSITYLLVAPEGFRLPYGVSVAGGVSFALAVFAWSVYKLWVAHKAASTTIAPDGEPGT